uniref:Glycosyltransferase family 1 protein n=1 Tax=candidate division WOR-3 bacterium TaxID=2052148 RepID=A0A7V3ZVR7_UNCW3
MEIIINGRFLTQKITGVQRYAQQLVKEIDRLYEKEEIIKKRFQFKILAPKSIIHHLELKHIPIKKIGFLKGHFWEQLVLPFYLKNRILLCLGNTAPLLTLFFNKKVIVTVHDLGFKYFPKNYRFLFRTFYSIIIPLILKYAWAIITDSQSEKEKIIKRYYFVKEKIFAIPQGGFSEELKAFDIREKNYLLYVGSLSKKKNFNGFLSALEIIVKKKLPLKAIAIISQNDIFEEIAIDLKPGIKERIKIIHQVSDEELMGYYKNAFLFVFPSFHEGAGIPPIEAMSCGCPVICSDIPSLRERCGEAALYFNPYSPEDIAQKIILLWENEELRKSLIEKGLERAKIFSWENTAKQTLKILEKVIYKK